jgi:hypothetical protein
MNAGWNINTEKSKAATNTDPATPQNLSKPVCKTLGSFVCQKSRVNSDRRNILELLADGRPRNEGKGG